jgi:hypothetical protein
MLLIHWIRAQLLVPLLAHMVMAEVVDENRWWPTQKPPRTVIRATIAVRIEPTNSPPYYHSGIDNGPVHMLVESLAGLAAKAVNEGRSEEMVWINTNQNPRSGTPAKVA